VKTKLFLSGIGILLALAGAVFLWLMWRSFQRASAMREWPEVEAVVLRSEVGERRIGNAGPAEFRFEVLFGYEWQGERLSSDRWSLRGSPWSKRREEARQLVDEHPAGSRVICLVNPEDPRVALVEVDSKAPGYSLWFPALFLIGGIGIVVGTWTR
jgi:hypothetical protein